MIVEASADPALWVIVLCIVLKGLDREPHKALLLLVRHIREDPGAQVKELCGVLPSLSRPQVRFLLRQLRDAREIHSLGTTRSARWYIGASLESRWVWISRSSVTPRDFARLIPSALSGSIAYR